MVPRVVGRRKDDCDGENNFFLVENLKFRFTRRVATLIRLLPVRIFLGALAFYVATLSFEATINSLPLTLKVAGLDWTPFASQPVLWLMTLPLKCLPVSWLAFSLNLMSAILAALILGLLARTVQLLQQRWQWKVSLPKPGLLPIFLACVLCGLEINFWQEATAATGEMLDLALLATAIWLLIEFETGRNFQWLEGAALVWGVGITENWLMLAALPLLAAYTVLLWWKQAIKGPQVLRLMAWGAAGLLFFALLPTINGLAPNPPRTLGQSWVFSFKQTLHPAAQVYHFWHQQWMAHRAKACVLALYFLLPVLVFAVRLPSEEYPYRRIEERILIWLFRRLQFLLLLACVWLAFDPPAGLRQLIARQGGDLMPLLTWDYVNALGAAFLAGHFLVAMRHKTKKQLELNAIPWLERVEKLGVVLVMVLIAVSLVVVNFPAVRQFNVHRLGRFGDLAVASLPVKTGIMFSDEPQELGVFKLALARQGKERDWLAVNAEQLPSVSYRAWLESRMPLGWVGETTRRDLKPDELIQLLKRIAQTNSLCYLHPSYGQMFEHFYLEPVGSVFTMKLREGEPAELPALPPALIQANEEFWNRNLQKDIATLAAPLDPPDNIVHKLIRELGFTPAPRRQDRLLAGWYSVLLDNWGVALQKHGKLPEAGHRLEQATALNDKNYSALLTLSCNQKLRAGKEIGLTGLDEMAAVWNSWLRLGALLYRNGPVDDPVFCLVLGRQFLNGGMPWQAMQQFQRAHNLVPTALGPELALTELYLQLRLFDRILPMISRLRESTKNHPRFNEVDLELSLQEANFWLQQTNFPKASAALVSVCQRHSDDVRIQNRVGNALLFIGDFTNALRVVDAQLVKDPHNLAALKQQATILMRTGNAIAAIKTLNHLLSLTNQPEARLDRAKAYIASLDYRAAERDLREMEKAGIELARVNLGLAEIAELRHDTNQALFFLRNCQSNTPTGSVFWYQAHIRIQTLEGGDKSGAENKKSSATTSP